MNHYRALGLIIFGIVLGYILGNLVPFSATFMPVAPGTPFARPVPPAGYAPATAGPTGSAVNPPVATPTLPAAGVPASGIPSGSAVTPSISPASVKPPGPTPTP